MLSRLRLLKVALPATFAAFALLVACSGQTAGGPNPAQGAAAGSGRSASAVVDLQRAQPVTTTPIQHVVVIIQENRSFDNLFNGYPGANTVQSGIAVPVGPAGTPIPGRTPMAVPLHQESLAQLWDIQHGYGNFAKAYDNGKNDGFSEEDTKCYVGGCQTPDPSTYPTYAFVPQSETGPYWALAHQYVLADDMFASNVDASFVAHQYLIAGWANHAVNYPAGSTWGCDNPNTTATLNKDRSYGPMESVCFTYDTLATELDKAHLDWRYYATSGADTGYLWSAFDAINAVRNGPEWSGGSNAKVINPPAQILTDAAAGNLVTGVTWLTPSLANSDHADSDSTTGPAWVASVVNAIGSNPKLWRSTAIFIVWDDWGGWYDHVVPPYVDFDGLGFRVPMLVVSGYSRHGYVTHVQYEFGSILKFIERNFGLGVVAPTNCCYGATSSERRANDPTYDAFDFTHAPRPFVPIPSQRKRDYFMHQPVDNRPIDTE